MANVIVEVFGSGYDHIGRKAEKSRENFKTRMENYFQDAHKISCQEIIFMFFSQALTYVATGEDFVIRITGLPENLNASAVAERCAAFAARCFSYSDCDSHDSWSIPRDARCIIGDISVSSVRRQSE